MLLEARKGGSFEKLNSVVKLTMRCNLSLELISELYYALHMILETCLKKRLELLPRTESFLLTAGAVLGNTRLAQSAIDRVF